MVSTASEMLNSFSSMEILPAQIALDPCSAGLVLTDPLSGELLTVDAEGKESLCTKADFSAAMV